MKVYLAILALIVTPHIGHAQQADSPIILSLVNDTLRVDIYPGDRVVNYDMKSRIVARGNPIGFVGGRLEVVGKRSNIVSLEEISRIDHIKEGAIGQPMTRRRWLSLGFLFLWGAARLGDDLHSGANWSFRTELKYGGLAYSVFAGAMLIPWWLNVSSYKMTAGGWSLLYESYP